MQVCIDCSPLLVRSSGVKTYIHQLTSHLQAAFGARVHTFPAIGPIGQLYHDGSALSTAGTLSRLGLLHLMNRRIIPPAFLVPKVDVFHTSNLVRNPPGHCRVTATIHDLTSWLMPELHRNATLRADREYAKRMWSRSDGLIAVSETSRRDAAEVLGIDPGKITVVHNGVADAYFRVEPEALSEVRELYRIQRPFVLFVSTIEPRKNLDRLITAYEGLSDQIRHEFEFLIAGPQGWNNDATLHRIRSHTGGVRYLGYVPEHHLPALFAAATLFAYPSLYEGFGLPVLQAMAAGTPVLTSATGALPEVAGDCAAYADPFSVSDMTQALATLLLSPSQRQRMSERGRRRASTFTWSACARKTWDCFEQVAGR